MEKSSSRWWDLPSAALFLLAILISVGRLTITEWTDDLDQVTKLALTGAVLGLALGVSHFEKRGVRWLALGYTLMLVPRQLIASYESRIYLGERLVGLGGRLLYSVKEFAANRPVEDPIFFIFLISILYWGIALVSGYQLTRHNNTLAAILPAGLTLIVIHQFDSGDASRLWLIALYLFIALALLGRGKYLRDLVAWNQRRVHLAPEAGPDLNVGMLIGAAVLILLAWSLPLNLSRAPALEAKWKDVTRPWRATRDRLSRAVEALQGKGVAERVESFRSTMALGSRAAQGSQLVMVVRVPVLAQDLPRLYWRARVYDRYDNNGWSMSASDKEKFHPESGGLPIPDQAGRKEYEFSITAYTRGQAVISLASQPLWASRPADVSYFPLENGQQDVLAFESFPYIEPGEIYRVRAAIANPSIEELRAAGQDYPAWVTAHYLQLPETFSKRISDFAFQATFGLETPYDKAQAITDILRSTIKYKSSVPPPPENTDVLEWFFFSLQEGYCNYYATTEVLMLRSLGIPARMAVGFAQGEPAESEQQFSESRSTARAYNIYFKNMHAWPEVYFPGIGWVEFEPTSNQEALVRPEKHIKTETGIPPVIKPVIKPTDGSDEGNNAPGSSASGFDWKIWLIRFMWLSAIFAIMFMLVRTVRKYGVMARAAEFVLVAAERRGDRFPAWVRNAALFALAEPFERAFHSVNVGLRWMGKPPTPNLTPAERAASLKILLPDAKDDIDVLLTEYQSVQYSKHGGDLRAARRSSRRLLRYSFLARWQRIWE